MAFEPSDSGRTTYPRLITIAQTPTGTFSGVPVGFNVGMMLEFKEDKTDPFSYCEGSGGTRRIVAVTVDEEPRCWDNETGPTHSFPERSPKRTVYLDFAYRQSKAELWTQPGDRAELKVADLGFKEFGLKVTFPGRNIEKRGLDILGSIAIGYASPSIQKNYGVLADLGVEASWYFAVGIDLRFDVTRWLYVSVPLSLGMSYLGFTSGTTTYSRMPKGSLLPGYFPTYAGAGLGLGFRIPVLAL